MRLHLFFLFFFKLFLYQKIASCFANITDTKCSKRQQNGLCLSVCLSVCTAHVFTSPSVATESRITCQTILLTVNSGRRKTPVTLHDKNMKTKLTHFTLWTLITHTHARSQRCVWLHMHWITCTHSDNHDATLRPTLLPFVALTTTNMTSDLHGNVSVSQLCTCGTICI